MDKRYNYFNNPQPFQQPQQQWAMPQQQMQQPQFLKGHPVSSLEEAKACSIDFDGSIFFFPDLANKRIYTKQINLDGTSTFNLYEYKEIPIESPVNNSYITREEFESAITPLQNFLSQVRSQQEQKKIPEEENKPTFNF